MVRRGRNGADGNKQNGHNGGGNDDNERHRRNGRNGQNGHHPTSNGHTNEDDTTDRGDSSPTRNTPSPSQQQNMTKRLPYGTKPLSKKKLFSEEEAERNGKPYQNGGATTVGHDGTKQQNGGDMNPTLTPKNSSSSSGCGGCCSTLFPCCCGSTAQTNSHTTSARIDEKKGVGSNSSSNATVEALLKLLPALLISLILFCHFSFLLVFLPPVIAKYGKINQGAPSPTLIFFGLYASDSTNQSELVARLADISEHGIYYLLVEHVLLIIVFYLLHLTSTTDPGRIPKTYPWLKGAVPDDPVPIKHTYLFGVEQKRSGNVRWCRFCKMHKPDRTHHCSKMGTCVLQFDHYCYYIRNCVGYRNKKYFLNLLFYGVVLVNYTLFMMIPHFLAAMRGIIVWIDVLIIFDSILTLFLAVIVNLFFAFHMYLVSKGFTTLEFMEKRRKMKARLRKFFNTQFDGKGRLERGESGQPFRADGNTPLEKHLLDTNVSLYDLGCINNFKEQLGPNPLLWFIPVRWGMDKDAEGNIKDGTRFRNRLEHLHEFSGCPCCI